MLKIGGREKEARNEGKTRREEEEEAAKRTLPRWKQKRKNDKKQNEYNTNKVEERQQWRGRRSRR